MATFFCLHLVSFVIEYMKNKQGTESMDKQELYHEWIKRKIAEDRQKYELAADRHDPVGDGLEVERKRQKEAVREYLKKV